MTEETQPLKEIANESTFILNATTADLFNALIVAIARMGLDPRSTCQSALEGVVRKLMAHPEVRAELLEILTQQGDLAYANTATYLSTGELEPVDVSMFAVVVAATIFEAWPRTNPLSAHMFKSLFGSMGSIPALVGISAMFNPAITGTLSAFKAGGASVWLALLEKRDKLIPKFVEVMAETAEEVNRIASQSSSLVLTDTPEQPQ